MGGIRHDISIDVPGHCIDMNKEKGIRLWAFSALGLAGEQGSHGRHIPRVSTPSYLKGEHGLYQSGWDESKIQKHRTSARC